MTKLTDVLRRLAEADEDQAARQVAVLPAPPDAEPVDVAPVPAPCTAERCEPAAVVEAQPVGDCPVHLDIARLRDFVTQNVRRAQERGGCVLLLVWPPDTACDAEGDAHAATGRLIHELAAALADGPGREALVLDMPPAQPLVRRSTDTGSADDGASIADVIRSRARLAEIVQPGGASRVWRAAHDRLPLRSPPAPWPALVALLGQCREHFAWTLIDGGPWDAAESAELARRADSVYLVLQEGRTGQLAARRTLAELRCAGANVSSCLFVGRATRAPSDA